MATVPHAPTSPIISAITKTSVHFQHDAPFNGGVEIDARQIGYSRDNRANPAVELNTGMTGTVSNLTPGIRYYFRSRMHNSLGWGPWGAYRSIVTLTNPDSPGLVTVHEVTQVTARVSFVDRDDGGSAILERQLGWSVSDFDRQVVGGADDLPTSTAKYNGGIQTVSNLIPGETYEFRSRVRTAAGWSTWSAAVTATTIAGAYVKVGGVWKKAIPYVRVGGVWKVARPWGRHFGFWEETT